MLILLGALDTFYVLLRPDARNHDLAAAAETADAKIHTNAKHRKLVAAARVVLFMMSLSPTLTSIVLPPLSDCKLL